MSERKLDFVIVGSMKSGTSSLSYHLGNHAQVCIPRNEMHFFDKDERYRKGRDWYLRTIYRNATARTRIAGEKTPTYSYQPNVAERMNRDFPDIKLVWVLRNPIDRAYSNYLHAYKDGFDLLSFEEAVEREPERIEKNIFHGYLERSKYAPQIERFLRYYPRTAMYVMIFEDFIADPTSELERLFAFLGITSEGFTFVDEPRNKTTIPWSPRLQYAYRQRFGKGAGFEILKWLNTRGKKAGYDKIKPETRAQLVPHFEASTKELETLLDRNLDVWRR